MSELRMNLIRKFKKLSEISHLVENKISKFDENILNEINDSIDEMTDIFCSFERLTHVNKSESIPDWIKVGQWVKNTINCSYGIITEINSLSEVKGNHVVIKYMDNDIIEGYTAIHMIHSDNMSIIPVNFREYNLLEAVNLLGKLLKFTSEDGCNTYIQTITKISEINGNIYINDLNFDTLTKYHATINNNPIGILVNS